MSAVRNLAFLHKELMECEAEKQYTERPIREEYARKGRELARIKKYLGTIYEKNKFEMMASKSFGEFIPEVESSINFADDFLAGIILKKSCAMVILTIIISDMAIHLES